MLAFEAVCWRFESAGAHRIARLSTAIAVLLPAYALARLRSLAHVHGAASRFVCRLHSAVVEFRFCSQLMSAHGHHAQPKTTAGLSFGMVSAATIVLHRRSHPLLFAQAGLVGGAFAGYAAHSGMFADDTDLSASLPQLTRV
jgi:hypothetical protein